jgi:hypothetical protein
MAAVLCGGIGTLCKGCCDCVSQICMLPFKICGVCCEGMGQCCSDSCKIVTSCCSSSFCCYITVACALNVPPIIMGLLDIPNAVAGCAGSLWLLVFWLLCLVHIVAAFYMAYAIEKDDTILPTREEDEERGTISHFQQTANEGAGRMTKLFCFDFWMAAYILVVLGYFGWLFLGGVWFATGTIDDSSSCSDSIHGRVGIAYAFGWAFVFLGGCGLCCSLCCGVFMKPPGNRHPHPAAAAAVTQQQQQSAKPTAAVVPDGNAAQAVPVYASATASKPTTNSDYYVNSSDTNNNNNNSTGSKPVVLAAPMMEEPPEVEVEAVPVFKPTAPMASAVPY